MGDVVQRLRAGLDAGAIDLADIMDAADEIERLRRGTAVSDNCVAGNQPEIPCPVTEPMPKEKRAEVSVAIHDAVPEAKAMHSRDCSGGLSGTGNTPEPVAWAVVGVGYEYVSLLRESAAEAARSGGGVMVPLYRQPQPTLTDAERKALSWFTGGRGPVCPQHLATIRGLMARLS